MQDEWLICLGDDLTCELCLFDRWVDDAVFVVLKDAKVLVQAHIDRGWLDHRLGKGLAADSSCGDLGTDIAITK